MCLVVENVTSSFLVFRVLAELGEALDELPQREESAVKEHSCVRCGALGFVKCQTQ